MKQSLGNKKKVNRSFESFESIVQNSKNYFQTLTQFLWHEKIIIIWQNAQKIAPAHACFVFLRAIKNYLVSNNIYEIHYSISHFRIT